MKSQSARYAGSWIFLSDNTDEPNKDTGFPEGVEITSDTLGQNIIFRTSDFEEPPGRGGEGLCYPDLITLLENAASGCTAALISKALGHTDVSSQLGENVARSQVSVRLTAHICLEERYTVWAESFACRVGLNEIV